MRPVLQVKRLRASELGENETIYFDEVLEVLVETPDVCEVQMSVQIEGNGQSVRIFEELLASGKQWSLELPVKHPRSQIDFSELEIVATAMLPNRRTPSLTEAEPYTPETQDELEIPLPQGVSPLEHHTKDVQKTQEEPDLSSIAKFRRRISQALHLNLRSKAPYLERDRLLAEISIGSRVSDLCLMECEATLEEGTALAMPSPDLPLNLEEGEKCSFGYSLQTISSTSNPVRQMVVKLQYKVGDAHVTTEWKPALNFQTSQGLLPKTPLIGNLRSPVPTVASSRGLNGLSLLFDGPTIVKEGETFDWKFRIVNNSPRTRKVILGLYPREKLGPPPVRERRLVATADALRNRINAYRIALGSDRGIIPLTSEVKLSALGPNACFEGTISLLALRPGTHTVDGSTLVDMLTGDIYEIGELLEVTVV